MVNTQARRPDTFSWFPPGLEKWETIFQSGNFDQQTGKVKNFTQKLENEEILTLADLGGVPDAPPTGPNSFVFAYIFIEKCLCWRPGCPPPQREILDPPLFGTRK